MIEQLDIDESLEPAELMALTEEQQARLASVLDQYLSHMEQSEPVDVEALKTQHPDLAEVLTLYLEKLNFLVKLPRTLDEGVEPLISEGAHQQLGDFKLLGEIGRRGMGVVYEAHQTSLNRRVAIKLLPLASMLDSHQIARFHNEARAAGLLQHDHIVPVYSVGVERGINYFAMQFIDGISMDAWIEGQRHLTHVGQTLGDSQEYHSHVPADLGGLSGSQSPRLGEALLREKTQVREKWQTVVSWVLQIAEALHTAHEAGVVHRDVKPSNIMFDKTGKIWITDFGLARCQTEMSLTRSGDVIGTMRYMSPEQARGQSALVDGRTDIYSLAATLFEMLTLRPAHAGDDAPTILQKIDKQEITPLRMLRPDLPRDLETVIAKAMSKNREARYETALEFAADLTRVLNGEATLARPATLADRLSRFASKHRSVVLTGATIVVLGFVGLAVASAKLAIAKQVSEANASQAILGETLARDAVDQLVQKAELLNGIPAADPIRRQLLSEALGYYERFAVAFNNDPGLREDLAIALGKMGSLQSELGDSEKAIESLTRSEAIYAELVNQPMAGDAVSLHWATSQNNLAQAYVRIGKLEDAARIFTRAIVTQESVVQRCVEGDEKQAANLGLATTLNNLGLLLTQTDALNEAEQTYQQAIVLLTEEGRQPDIAMQQRQLAAVRTNLSGLITNTSPQRAVETALQALAWQLDALESDRGNAKLATQTIVTLNTLGAAQSAAGQNTAAIETFHRAIEIGKQLLARWPDQPTYRRDLVLCFNHLGLSFSKSGELTEACAAFDEALAQGRPLAALFASDAETQSMLGGVLNNLGFLRQQLGDQQKAADAYYEAIEHQTAAVELAPEVKRYREYLKKHQENYDNLVTTTVNKRRVES